MEFKKFDEKIVNNLYSLICDNDLSNILIRENYKLYKLIYCFSIKVKSIINNINKDYICYHNFDIFIIYVSIIKDGLKEIFEDIKENNYFKEFFDDFDKNNNKSLFYSEWSSFLLNYMEKKEIKLSKNKLKNDNNFFEYIRSLCLHPFNTSRHPMKVFEKEKFKNQIACLCYISEPGNTYVRSDAELTYNVTFEIKNKDDLNLKYFSRFLVVRLEKIIIYADNLYKKINKFVWFFYKFRKNYLNSINLKIDDNFINENNNNKFLDKIIDILDKKGLETEKLLCLKEKYNHFISNELLYKENHEIINEFFEYVFKYIKENINRLKSNRLEINASFLDSIYSIWEWKNDIKIKYRDLVMCHLLEKEWEEKQIKNEYYSILKDKDDAELYCRTIFNKLNENKYIKMDINNKKLTPEEKQILIDVLVYKFNKKNKK